MNILGISAGFHDAAATIVNRQGDILFASHSERYSKQKNDPDICASLAKHLSSYAIDTVAYYERPLAKQLRQWYSGQGIEWNKLTVHQNLKSQLHDFDLDHVKIKNYNHHLCHAAAGFQTSPYDRATVVVIDAIGEWDTISIWAAEYIDNRAQYKKLWRQIYPHSIGLFYSAITCAVGLKPMDEEYITMGMAAYGSRLGSAWLKEQYIADLECGTFKKNLHLGFDQNELMFGSHEDIAASAQDLAEALINSVMCRAKSHNWSSNLVYMGGVALNCLANRNLGKYFEQIWIMPNPGDAGSSLGAAALAHGGHIHWRDAYLGHDIVGNYPVDAALEILCADSIVGIANGRAEFGPRALGNRSLLADPRGNGIKDKVNEIKQRQKFRPFAPVILEEYLEQFFEMPKNWINSRYMQVIARCKHPDLYPAIVHYDGTSRVQTVPADNSGIRQLLESWHQRTGCPMLLNTSLNVRGEPMVNDREDADRFQSLYGVKVLS